MNKTKQCSKCKETKATSEFNKDKTGKDGLQPYCRSCQREYQQARDKNLVHQTPDTKQCRTCKETKDAAEFPKKRSSKDGLDSRCKLCDVERCRKYREENPEKRAETCRKYCEENPEKRVESCLKWAKENPGKVKAIAHRRRARKLNASGDATAADIKARFEYHGNKCIYCGAEENLHIEHRIPLSRGGSNHPANLVPACKSCNCKKGTKTETEYKEFLLTQLETDK